MKAVARASIDLQGRDLRYAEVEQYGNRYRLLRLGSCDFDFDVVRELVQEPESGRLISVREALRDVLSGSIASVIRFVLHPPAVRTFFSAVPLDLPRSSQHIRAQQEAALLYGVGPSLTVDHEIAVAHQGDGDSTETWQSVSVTITDVRRKLGRLAAALPGSDLEVLSGRVASGHALRRYQHVRRDEPAELVLAIGCFPDHFDIAYGAEGEWLYSYAAANVIEPDAAYLSAEILRRLGFGPQQVGRILMFGNNARPDLPSFERLYGTRPVVFDPLMLVNLDPATIEDNFDGGAYLQCVGGAL